MSDLNTITLIGRLTKDLNAGDSKEFSYLPNNTPKMNFSIAVNQSVNRNGQWTEEASFFNVTLFGKSAENLKSYMTKGKQVAITGRLKQDRWTDQNGQNQSRIYIVADNVQLLGGNNQQNNNAMNNGFNQNMQQQGFQQQPQQQYQQQNPQMQQQPQQYQQQAFNGMNNFPDEVPF